MQIIHDEPPVSHAFASTVAPHGGEKNGDNPVFLKSGDNPVFLKTKSSWNSLRRVLMNRKILIKTRHQIVSENTVYKQLQGQIAKLGYESTGNVLKVISRTSVTGPTLILTGSRAMDVTEPNGCRKILGTFGAFLLEGGSVVASVRIDSGVNPCDAQAEHAEKEPKGKMTE